MFISELLEIKKLIIPINKYTLYIFDPSKNIKRCPLSMETEEIPDRYPCTIIS